MSETMEGVRIGAARQPGHPPQRVARWRGAVIAVVWRESADGCWAWHEHRTVVVTITTYPTEHEAVAAMKRIAWGQR